MMDPEYPDPRLADLDAPPGCDLRMTTRPTAESFTEVQAYHDGQIENWRRWPGGTMPAQPAESNAGGLGGAPEGPRTSVAAEAVLAGAEALSDVYGCSKDRDTIATLAYDAMAPHIRRQVAEQIADAIEAECIDPDWPNDDISVNGARAVAIARQIGAS